jgi:hypothetical protein
MSGGVQYRDTWYALAPPWLRTGNAERYMYTLELLRDLLVEKQDQAIRFRWPGEGDVSQLPYLAHDRQLERGPAETAAAFTERLQDAPTTWGLAGTRVAVLGQLQAYMQGLQPGVDAKRPVATIVGGCYPEVSTWDTLYQGDAIGAAPSHAAVVPANFDWDGQSQPWRAWLVLPLLRVGVGLAGAAAAIAPQTNGGSFTSPGQNVSGVWVPATSGTPVNTPFATVSGLTGLSAANVGQWLVLSGSSHGANNVASPIVAVTSATACTIANPFGVLDPGPLTWSISAYPWIGPGPVWGAPGYVFGNGEQQVPAIDTGALQGGVWGPRPNAGGAEPTISWGLTCSSDIVDSLRAIVRRWKSAATYYPMFVFAFDAGSGVAGNAYSPNSVPGAGNPDGTFGSVGRNVSGVWVPTRSTGSPYNAFAQGTGVAVACSVENET